MLQKKVNIGRQRDGVTILKTGGEIILYNIDVVEVSQDRIMQCGCITKNYIDGMLEYAERFTWNIGA